ncbi:MAG: S1/P1 nuclease [Bacteroidota bacterium]|nr:S1/P1 nuclease [Bacteroidota bacterium]
MKIKMLVFVIVFSIKSSSVFSFGKEGHALVGQIAMNYLTTESKARLKQYLGNKTLGDIASWMDEVKQEYPETKPMHFINIEKDETYVANNAVNIINELNIVIAELKSFNEYSDSKTETNLKYLTHLVGDLHQPLHVGYGADLGGNNVVIKFKGKKAKLHGIWDSNIIKETGIDLEMCLAEASKLSKEETKKITKTNVVAWMAESRAYLTDVYNFKKNEEIPETYIANAKSILVKQLLRAGLRLAEIINSSFAAGASAPGNEMIADNDIKLLEHAEVSKYNNIKTPMDLVFVEYPQYSVGYSEKYKIPIWAYYELSDNEALNCVVDRKGSFKADKEQNVAQASDADYATKANAGKVFHKGHMVPCESLTYDCDAMASTFFYTNSVPQTQSLNGGPWRVLEEYINDWAVDNGRVLIFTGNFVSDKSKKIGPNKIAVPDSCFKIVVDISKPGIKGIAFIMPNANGSLGKPEKYVRSIDQVEQYLGFDFFSDFSASLQKQFESKSKLEDWDFVTKRYDEERKKNCKKYNKAYPDGPCKCKVK